MSNDDLGGLPPLGSNPLDGDLFGEMPPPAVSPLGPETLPADEGAALAPVAAPAVSEAATVAEPVPEEPKEKVPSLLTKLAASSPYTMMLVVSVVALLIGIVCLLLEWGSYRFDTKAKAARQTAQIVAPLDPAAQVASLPGGAEGDPACATMVSAHPSVG